MLSVNRAFFNHVAYIFEFALNLRFSNTGDLATLRRGTADGEINPTLYFRSLRTMP